MVTVLWSDQVPGIPEIRNIASLSLGAPIRIARKLRGPAVDISGFQNRLVVMSNMPPLPLQIWTRKRSFA
jgi:hypothetical protein